MGKRMSYPLGVSRRDVGVVSLAELRKLETGIPAARLGNHVKILLRRGYYGMIKRGLYQGGQTAAQTPCDPLGRGEDVLRPFLRPRL